MRRPLAAYLVFRSWSLGNDFLHGSQKVPQKSTQHDLAAQRLERDRALAAGDGLDAEVGRGVADEAPVPAAPGGLGSLAVLGGRRRSPRRPRRDSEASRPTDDVNAKRDGCAMAHGRNWYHDPSFFLNGCSPRRRGPAAQVARSLRKCGQGVVRGRSSSRARRRPTPRRDASRRNRSSSVQVAGSSRGVDPSSHPHIGDERRTHMTTPDDIRNVAIAGPQGLGQDLARRGHALRRQGDAEARQVGRQASVLDDTPEERAHVDDARGAARRPLTWNGEEDQPRRHAGRGELPRRHAPRARRVRRGDRVRERARRRADRAPSARFGWMRERSVPACIVVTQGRRRAREARRGRRRLQAAPQDAGRDRWRCPTASGPSFQGVIALRTGKAWIGKPEAPNATATVPIPPESKPDASTRRARTWSTTSPAPTTRSPRST